MVVTTKKKEVVKFIYACSICGDSFRSAVQSIDHYMRIHGYSVPRRSVGRRRPAHPDYDYQNKPDGECDCEHYACGSCWFHTPADKKGLAVLRNHFFEAHHPKKVDSSKDNGEEYEPDDMEEEQETHEDREDRKEPASAVNRRRSTASTHSDKKEDMATDMPTLKIIDDKDKTLEPINQTLCEISCQKQFSNYVCPRCNLRYCSLTCYKDLKHADCTENFYRESVTAEIQSREVDKESKHKMLEMLQRLEQDNQEFEEEHQDDAKYEALLEKFSEMDIENTDPDLIWNLLSEQEREEFKGSLKELQEMGNWSQWGLPDYTPWWLESTPLISDAQDTMSLRRPTLPSQLPDFSKLTQPSTRSSPHIMWYLLHILGTYAYLMRHTMGDLLEDKETVLALCQTLSADVLYSNVAGCPFASVNDLIGNLVERIIEWEEHSAIQKRGAYNPKRRYDIQLMILRDLKQLLREAGLAMSDFWQTMDKIQCSYKKKRKSHVLATRKLYFYFAAACFIDQKKIDVLLPAIENEIKRSEAEKEELLKYVEAAKDAIDQFKKSNTSKIQEL
ncbi:hypothetical protein BD560DRAFT_426087 [Blakeslea trispora]|nr:hypothetical protein BD560DRAFT_426087 [Blakeslea trispora]